MFIEHFLFFSFSFYFIVFTFTYMCIHCVRPPYPLPGRICSGCLLFWFCWRENIKDSKKDIAVLLVWDKNCYTERFLALEPFTCVLWSTLVHFYQTSSLLPGPLPIMASANLRLLYLLLKGKHINHFQVLDFLPFPFSSSAHSPLSVWPRPMILLH
jgi:hypothetical protein